MLAGVALLALLAAPGCDRLPGGRRAPPPPPVPLPELSRLAELVEETRAILPRVPPVALPPLPPATPEAAPSRPVLQGTASLIRRGAIGRLPAQLRVTLHLPPGGDGAGPGGHLEVTPAGDPAERWPLGEAHRLGDRAGTFLHVYRTHDRANRLRWLVLLGSLYEADGARFRAFEGYLVVPGPGGALGPEAPRYAVDFGYRWPEPPPAVTRAEALAERLAGLARLLGAWREAGADLAAAEKTLGALRTAQVPPEQEARRRRDLAEWQGRLADLRRRRADLAGQLADGLRTALAERRRVAEGWVALTDTNPYRWRTPAERRALYAPLAALDGAGDVLERVFAALPPGAQAGLAAARDALADALLREAEARPPPAGEG